MDRTYLFVPPEEKAEVQSLGAEWDSITKRWYIGPNQTPAGFSRWLPPFEEDVDADAEDLDISSNESFVAATTIACHRCHANIEVISIYCATGAVGDEPLTEFTVSEIWAMDEDLIRQLKPWTTFRKLRDDLGKEGNFANHCSQCGAVQEDLYLQRAGRSLLRHPSRSFRLDQTHSPQRDHSFSRWRAFLDRVSPIRRPPSAGTR